MASQRASRELNEHHNRLANAVPRAPTPGPIYAPPSSAAPAAGNEHGGWTEQKDRLNFLIKQRNLTRSPRYHNELWQAAFGAGYKRDEIVKMFGETKDDYAAILARALRLTQEADARARAGSLTSGQNVAGPAIIGPAPTPAPSPAPASPAAGTVAAPPAAPAEWLAPTLAQVGRQVGPALVPPLPWTGSAHASCLEHCRETLRQSDGSVYEGNSHEGKPHGLGRLQRAGLVVTGRFSIGTPFGEARIEYPNGAVYEGEVDGMLARGNGRFSWPDGSAVSGRFLQGAFNGQIERLERYEQGLRKITGRYEMGRPVGVHQVEFGDKSSVLRASMNYAEPTKSVIEYRNGDRFEGLARGASPREGVLQRTSGARFQGSFYGHGRPRAGVWTLPDGTVQVGYWQDDERRQGYVVTTWANGTVAERTFQNNRPVGYTIETTPQGDVFSGTTLEPGFEVFGILVASGASPDSAVPKGRRPGQAALEDLPAEYAARAREVARAAAERLTPERARLEAQLGQ